ncbi:hypothetical protein IW150_006624 [Coemansia sp. RSA 2607]|nr:hypothetical protein IW150_006624 [Coemansia sp. RSA 2607]
MPPVDLFRAYASGYEIIEPQKIAVIVEKIVMRAANSTTPVAIATTRTTAMIIREMRSDLVPSASKGPGKLKHRNRHRHSHRRHRHYRIRGNRGEPIHHRHHRPCHGHHHRHHKHSKKPEKVPDPAPDQPPVNHVGHGYTYHTTPHAFGYQHHQIHSGSRLADFALGELGFLALSFVLSMVLLLVGYKIGECVYKFENSRNRTRGCGHRNSLARRHACRGTQTSHYGENDKQKDKHSSPPPQPIYLEEDIAINEDAVEAVALSVTAPNAARTKGRGI